MDALEIAKKTFEEIQGKFPDLRMELNENHPHVELAMEIPKQIGVLHPVHLNLQNSDELHFQVSNFGCEWFPCTDDNEAHNYKQAVVGYLSGNYRILEYFKGKNAYKAELQSPRNGDWQTIATWGKLWRPIFKKVSHVVVKNA